MAEVVGFAASVVAIIEIAGKIVQVCKFYIETARGDAPKDLKLVLVETSSLKSTLESLDFLLTTGTDSGDDATELARHISDPINACRSSIAELLDIFPANLLQNADTERSSSVVGNRERAARLLNALAWPLKRSKALALLDRIARYRDTIHLGLSVEIGYVKHCCQHLGCPYVRRQYVPS